MPPPQTPPPSFAPPPQQFGPPPGAPPQPEVEPPQFGPLPGAPTQLELEPPQFLPSHRAPPPQQFGPPPGAPPPQQFGPPPGAPPPQQFGPPPGAPQQYGPPPGAPMAYGPPQPHGGMMGQGEVMTYPLHAGARGAYMVVGVLLFILIIGIPFAIWAFIARSRGRMEVRGLDIRSFGFFTRQLDLSRARRLGVLEVPIYARGIGGAIARRKVGGNKAVHLCTMDEQGRKANILVSMYERFPDIIQHAQRMTGLPLEEVKVGALGPKWPG